ncbi:RagB/SusD family nutrient uptake outer membrane protein [Maribellus comscasis]|uniref:RagB/SusD family nutrient uptake outer membrane protein n=1 Tax=Maribellus comscasis TaxID=2681766 RepID=A0A6I6K3P7_9BACT|nr:RagB/SusD family nutrient uptake outer membrane protein [Maribellus comscasis]QGY46213.1 RagB/SusD family nutrient uptake outer membrane protein [Maribellus comscasis]
MKNLKYIILSLGLILTIGCEDILEPSLNGQAALEDLISTEDGIITTITGAYEPLMSIYDSNLDFVVTMASDDGWTWRKETEADLYILDADASYIESIWSQSYTGITRANTVLSNIERVEDFSSTTMENAIKGQAKFLRALYYFNLARLMGGVPLIVEEIETREDAEQPRASISDVYTQIKTDLNDAIDLLPTVYTGETGMEVGRATSYAASALKAIVHLELEEYDEANELTAELLDKGNLLSDYAANFNGTQENGDQVFFETQFGGSISSTTTSKSDNYAPSDYNGLASPLPTDDNFNGEGGGLSSGDGFVQLFESGDLRKDVIIKTYGLANFIDASQPDGSLYFVNKYYNTSDSEGKSTWNFPLIRYAEILLVRAEILNELGYEADGEAFDLLNMTRTNAGLTALSSIDLPDQATFRTALRKEKRIELAFEAKRYFDLNRWGILQETIQNQMDYLNLTFPGEKLITHPLTGKDYFLFPIPSSEFVNNASLGEQNSGY